MEKKNYEQSKKLDNVCYDIRGPVMDEAMRMEARGANILKLNIGNPAPFGFYAPDEVILDMIYNLRNCEGYSDSRGLFSARKAIMQYCQLKGIPNVGINDIFTGNGVSELITLTMQGLLDDGDERHRGSDGGGVGFQQHAAAHLRQVDAAHRNVSVAGVCHHELSGAVFDGRAVCADGSLGRRCTDRVLFDRTGGVESGSEELYVGKHVRSF